MQKILKVAQREYIETVKTKTFIISIVMLPVTIALVVAFAGKLESSSRSATQPPIKVAVTDLSNQLSIQIKASFDKHNTDNPNRRVDLDQSQATDEQQKEKLRRGMLDVYVVLDENVLDDAGKIHLYTYKAKPSVIEALWTVESPLRDAVFRQRCKKHNLSPDLVGKLRNLPIERKEIGVSGDQERVQSEGDRVVRVVMPLFFMYLLFLGIFGMGGQMLSSIIEEKNSRVIEVLLSAVSPFQLMAGKILGLGSVGLTVVFLWGASACGVARWKGLGIDITPELLISFVLYYVLGYFLLSSLMVGIGSICNTIKESQSLLKPIILVCIVPIIAWLPIVRDPNGTLARVLSFFPPTAPMVMVLRLSSGTTIWNVEIILSILLLAVSVLAAVWVAGRVFRVGILMYGKRPGLREVARWLKQT